jgi:hypothetical protein
MRIKVFIVTYRNEFQLNNNLQTLFHSDLMNHDYEITVINNNRQFKLHDQFHNKVTIFHNVVRPDFSTGHLARDWNCALINGFKDLNNPDADIVVHVQDDTIFNPGWAQCVINLHNRYSFLQFGWGDNYCSYTADAVKKIGLWDERFCNIGQQEADYLLRAYLHNRNNSSINDGVHGRMLNPVPAEPITRPEHEKYDYHSASTLHYNGWSDALYFSKWGKNAGIWSNQYLGDIPPASLIKNFVYYPYFEKNVENLVEKNYLVPR